MYKDEIKIPLMLKSETNKIKINQNPKGICSQFAKKKAIP